MIYVRKDVLQHSLQEYIDPDLLYLNGSAVTILMRQNSGVTSYSIRRFNYKHLIEDKYQQI